MRAKSFSDLGAMQKQLAAQARAEKEAAQARALAEAHRLREQQLFALTVGAVKPIKDGGRASIQTPAPLPLALQREFDDSAVMQAALSD